MSTMRITAAPSRTMQQRLAALERANDVRSRRARIKEQIRDSGKTGAREQVAELLTEPPPVLDTMKVWDLLIAQPTFGRVKTGKTLGKVRVSPSKTVGGLSPRQRGDLVRLLRG